MVLVLGHSSFSQTHMAFIIYHWQITSLTGSFTPHGPSPVFLTASHIQPTVIGYQPSEFVSVLLFESLILQTLYSYVVSIL